MSLVLMTSSSHCDISGIRVSSGFLGIATINEEIEMNLSEFVVKG